MTEAPQKTFPRQLVKENVTVAELLLQKYSPRLEGKSQSKTNNRTRSGSNSSGQLTVTDEEGLVSDESDPSSSDGTPVQITKLQPKKPHKKLKVSSKTHSKPKHNTSKPHKPPSLSTSSDENEVPNTENLKPRTKMKKGYTKTGQGTSSSNTFALCYYCTSPIEDGEDRKVVGTFASHIDHFFCKACRSALSKKPRYSVKHTGLFCRNCIYKYDPTPPSSDEENQKGKTKRKEEC